MDVIAWFCVALCIVGGVVLFAFSPAHSVMYLVFSLSLLFGLGVAWLLKRRAKGQVQR